MRNIKGLSALIAARGSLPEVGWIFVDKGFDKTLNSALVDVNFYIPENDDDEFFGEDNLSTWLEAPTFLGVLQLREKKISSPSIEQYAEAAIHYIEADDFLE